MLPAIWKSKAKTCCTTESLEYPGALHTTIPFLPAYSISILLYPVANKPIYLRFLHLSITSAVIFALLQITASASPIHSATILCSTASKYLTFPSLSRLVKSISPIVTVFLSKITIFIKHSCYLCGKKNSKYLLKSIPSITLFSYI